MTRSRPLLTSITVVAAAAVAVGGVQLVAAAGPSSPVVLGASNRATKTTTIKVTRAKPALKLKTKPGVAPLEVRSSTRVDKLNADLLDGKDSTAFGTTVYSYDLPAGDSATSHRVHFPGLPAGTYLVSYSVLAKGAPDLQCGLHVDTLTPAADRVGLSYGAAGALGRTANGSGLVANDAPAVTYVLDCTSTGAFTFGAVYPTDAFSQSSQVTFTRVDQVVGGPAD